MHLGYTLEKKSSTENSMLEGICVHAHMCTVQGNGETLC